MPSSRNYLQLLSVTYMPGCQNMLSMLHARALQATCCTGWLDCNSVCICCAVYLGQTTGDLGEVFRHAWWSSERANCHLPEAVLQALQGGNFLLLCLCTISRAGDAELRPRRPHVNCRFRLIFDISLVFCLTKYAM